MNKKQLRFVSPDDVETLVLPWGKIQWLSEPGVTGSEIMTTGVVDIEAGKGHERHNHPDCDEIIYVTQGQGEQFIEYEDGSTEKRIVTKGDLIFIPANLYHGTLNTGEGLMQLLVVYQSAGPEALLKASPDCEIIPANNPS